MGVHHATRFFDRQPGKTDPSVPMPGKEPFKPGGFMDISRG